MGILFFFVFIFIPQLVRALWLVSGLAGGIYITVIYTGLKFKGLLSIWLQFTCEFWTIMSIIRVKGMFLTTQSHNFGRSCLWVDARRSSTVVLLELKDIYYFSRSVLKVTEPWAINPSRKNDIVLWLADNHYSSKRIKILFSSRSVFEIFFIDGNFLFLKDRQQEKDYTPDIERGCVCRQ